MLAEGNFLILIYKHTLCTLLFLLSNFICWLIILTEMIKATSYFHAGLDLNEYPVFAPLSCIWNIATSFTASMFSVLTFPTEAKFAC